MRKTRNRNWHETNSTLQGIANLVFFIPYIIFQPPSTVLVRKLGPRLHLSLVTLLWGAVMIGMGFAQDFTTISALRAVLGVLEAGFFPACVYLLSTWYTRCKFSLLNRLFRR